MTNQQIFIKAHKLARENVEIVGDYKVAFVWAIKTVYAGLKNNVEQKLTNLGCSVWEKYGKKRIYFNDNQLAKVFGLVVARYKTGAIKNAELNGEKISNSKAGKIIANNPYFDCLSNSFVSADLNPII